MNPCTIYACENYPVALEGLRIIVERSQEFRLAGSASELLSAIHEVELTEPMIFMVGQPHGARTILPLVSELGHCRAPSKLVLWVGECSEVEIFRALQMGICGIVRKAQTPAVLLECLRAVARGVVWIENSRRDSHAHDRRPALPRITRREREIIAHVCRGMKNKEIAQTLCITPGTVKVHLMHIFEKTGLKDRLQLALHGPQLLHALESQDGISKKQPRFDRANSAADRLGPA